MPVPTPNFKYWQVWSSNSLHCCQKLSKSIFCHKHKTSQNRNRKQCRHPVPLKWVTVARKKTDDETVIQRDQCFRSGRTCNIWGRPDIPQPSGNPINVNNSLWSEICIFPSQKIHHAFILNLHLPNHLQSPSAPLTFRRSPSPFSRHNHPPS